MAPVNPVAPARRFWGAGVTALAAILVCGSLAETASQTEHGSASAITSGKETFLEYCAACHGDRGTGNGPAASALRKRPPNLRTLAKRKGGFSAADVEAAIRGVEVSIPAHGSPEMPVWGHYFTAVDRTDADAQQRITNLVTFIESLQFK